MRNNLPSDHAEPTCAICGDTPLPQLPQHWVTSKHPVIQAMCDQSEAIRKLHGYKCTLSRTIPKEALMRILITAQLHEMNNVGNEIALVADIVASKQ